MSAVQVAILQDWLIRFILDSLDSMGVAHSHAFYILDHLFWGTLIYGNHHIGRGRSSFLPRRLLQWAAMGRSRGPVDLVVMFHGKGSFTEMDIIMYIVLTMLTKQNPYEQVDFPSKLVRLMSFISTTSLLCCGHTAPARGHIASFGLQDFPETERQMVVQQRGLPIFKAGNSCQRWTNESKMSVIDCSLRDRSCWI